MIILKIENLHIVNRQSIVLKSFPADWLVSDENITENKQN